MRYLLLLIVTILAGCRQDQATDSSIWPNEDRIAVSWTLIDDALDGDDKRTSFFEITNLSDTIIHPGWELYFSQFPTSFYLPGEATNSYEIGEVSGDLYKISTLDSFPVIAPGASVRIKYQWPITFIKKTHGPQGLFFSLPDGQVKDVTNYEIRPIPPTMAFATNSGQEPLHISAEKRYAQYSNIESMPTEKLSPILPTPVEINRQDGFFTLAAGVEILHDRGLEREADHLASFIDEILSGPLSAEKPGAIMLQLDGTGVPERYRLHIGDTGITITAGAPPGIFYGIQSLKLLVPAAIYGNPQRSVDLPKVSILDFPRFSYRGQHLDVARNFQSVEQVKKILDLMALYKLNKFHFHLTDDEGWRLEIPGIPELTEVGARRGFDVRGQMLPPAYGSGGNKENSGNGFYSKEEFVDILKYASDLHIEVIPEINGPGHARAAIKAMEFRADRTGNEDLLLHDPDDQSTYTSAQNYRDNVICVCRESTYSFLEKVIDELVLMYEEADAPLSIVHSGGDEVPIGAWAGSPICKRLMEDEIDIHSVHDLHPYFVERYLALLNKYDLKIGGWEEITLRHTEDGNIPNSDFIGKPVVSYAWNAIVGSGGEDMAYQLANAGYNVVLCNASNLYFDLSYNYEPEEPGLFWAGYVDTKNAFELTPSNIFLSIFEDEEGNPLDGFRLSRERQLLSKNAEKNILGIQGQLWSETVKNGDMAEYSLLPKLLGLAERAWARNPPWVKMSNRDDVKESIDKEWSAFANRLGKFELPRIDSYKGGYFYRISPPGIQIKGSTLYINGEYPGLEIRYTLDGSDPNPFSALYSEPVAVTPGKQIKARTFTTSGRASRLVTARSPSLN